MMTSQIEGTDTTHGDQCRESESDSDVEHDGDKNTHEIAADLVEWLRANKVDDETLIQELIDEGVEDVEDLFDFEEGELRARLLNAETEIKIGIIGKFLKALKLEKKTRELQNDKDTAGTSVAGKLIIMLNGHQKSAINRLQSELVQIQKKLQLLPQRTKGIVITSCVP